MGFNFQNRAMLFAAIFTGLLHTDIAFKNIMLGSFKMFCNEENEHVSTSTQFPASVYVPGHHTSGVSKE